MRVGCSAGGPGSPCLGGGLRVFSKTRRSQSARGLASSVPESLNWGFMLLTNRRKKSQSKGKERQSGSGRWGLMGLFIAIVNVAQGPSCRHRFPETIGHITEEQPGRLCCL